MGVGRGSHIHLTGTNLERAVDEGFIEINNEALFAPIGFALGTEKSYSLENKKTISYDEISYKNIKK